MKLDIRNVQITDAEEIVDIEKKCFPASEAASRESILNRIATFPENIFVAEYDGKVVGFINGCTTDSIVIFDDMFHDTRYHVPNGEYIAIFGLDVLAEYRGKGIATSLINRFIDHAKMHTKKAVILTCKENLISFYTNLGFSNLGLSKSIHGGEVWYDMVYYISCK